MLATRIRTVLGLAFAVATLLLTTGCDPHEGDSCKTNGEFYTHVDDKGNRTSLRCQPSGIDTKGRQTYRWVKA